MHVKSNRTTLIMNRYPINIEPILKARLPRPYRSVPKWGIRPLEWLMCIDRLNEGLVKFKAAGKYGTDAAQAVVEFQDCTYSVVGADNLPSADTPCIFASNHPLGGMDGVVELAMLGGRYHNVKAIVNGLLAYLEPLAPAFIPISVFGKQSRADMEALDNAYQDTDNQILCFPAGECSRLMRWSFKLRDKRWAKSVITYSVKTQRTIVPIYFEGRNSTFFYAFDLVRAALGISIIATALLLPWQCIRYARHKHYTVYIGKPIPYTTFTPDKTPQEWADWLKEQTYNCRHAVS